MHSPGSGAVFMGEGDHEDLTRVKKETREKIREPKVMQISVRNTKV